MTKARGEFSLSLSINGLQFPQFGQQRQQRQSDDGEVVTFEALKQLKPLAFELLGTNRGQCLLADIGQMAANEARIKLAHGHARHRNMPPYGLAIPRQNHGTVVVTSASYTDYGDRRGSAKSGQNTRKRHPHRLLGLSRI